MIPGLTARALAAWAGTDRLSALPVRLPRDTPRTPAGALFALCVAGRDVPAAQLDPAALDALDAHAVVERAGDLVRARVALLPVARGVVICDRLDAPVERALVCWPDDSSYHLMCALTPGRRARWLDLGCGSAFAMLARPELADELVGSDVNPRALAYARLGAELSGLARLATCEGDLAAPPGAFDLVTCNAPIPAAADPALWRAADPDFVERAVAAAGCAVAPGGMVVVHAAEDALAPVVATLPGERVIVAYTPDGARGFAVAWWRPDAAPRLVATRRALAPDRPHIAAADRDAALT